MRRAALGFAFVAALHLGGPMASRAAPPGKTDAETARLIAQLGSKHFRDRDAATQALSRIGPPALEALRRAAQAGDPEVRHRAAVLVEKLEKQLESERLLAPRRIRLVCKDTPISEAVSDLAQKAGLSVVLSDADRTRLGQRRVTLDTGETTFWEALDQLCRKAELAERRREPPRDSQNRVLTDGQGNQVIIIEQLTTVRQPENRLVLAAGKPDAAPTCYAGGVRIRALSSSTPHAGLRKTERETFVVLEVMAEPAIHWRGVADVQVDRAVDEQGQRLTQVLAPSALTGLELELAVNVLPFVEVDGELIGADPHQTPVRLRLGKEPSRVLKELHGTVAAHVETTEPLLTVDDLMKAANRTFHGKDGSTLQITDVRRDEDGDCRLHVHLDSVQLGLGRGAAQVFRGNRRLIFLNRGEPRTLNSGGWSLVDAGGHKIPLHAVSQRLRGGINGISQDTTFTFSARDARSPLKLTYTGVRTATVEVPFTLKDVPLP